MTYCHDKLSYDYIVVNMWIVSAERHGSMKPNAIDSPMMLVMRSDLDIVIKLSVIIYCLHIYYPVYVVLSIEKIMIVCNKLKRKRILGKYPRKGRGWL